jgi:hypothetical protein
MQETQDAPQAMRARAAPEAGESQSQHARARAKARSSPRGRVGERGRRTPQAWGATGSPVGPSIRRGLHEPEVPLAHRPRPRPRGGVYAPVRREGLAALSHSVRTGSTRRNAPFPPSFQERESVVYSSSWIPGSTCIFLCRRTRRICKSESACGSDRGGQFVRPLRMALGASSKYSQMLSNA